MISFLILLTLFLSSIDIRFLALLVFLPLLLYKKRKEKQKIIGKNH